ncbi:NAD(P)-binding protein [Cucurbitaria berberidis CBS 394.84]|uniref:NAD(P)-binding protein n=1 Tax=Cucurbitaria berberidis CBS 394.84 TaxID=1168544 RepID=A0A9P4GD28_9PLEO|nr:NAD(P)-binding protein [Cucurbitaria berberidis CBS 394.84]KAF1843678.1 NAD(P)-binding protein [Cucurbitaria berberidis CBS 394.84]
MPTLALAGGTSASLGRAIVSGVLFSPSTKLWNVVIFSRSLKVPAWLRAIDPQSERTTIKVVDYLKVDSIVPSLKGVDTLISVTSAMDGTQAQIQINLLNAAVAAGCRRFAPTQWEMGLKGYETGLIKSTFEGVWEACIKNQERIELARFNCGMFMNYIGHGLYSERPSLDDEQALKSGHGYADGADAAIQGLSAQGDLKDGSGGFMISLKNAIAELPTKADGSWPTFSTTSLRDVGYFVAAALELSEWQHDMSMSGDKLTIGDLLKYAEEATGKTFDVERLSPADLELQMSKTDPDDFMGQLWLELKYMFTKDEEDLCILKPVLNGLCPDVKPISVKEYIHKFYQR